MVQHGGTNYTIDVIQAGDDASAHFKKAAINANQKSLAHALGMLDGNRLLLPGGVTVTQKKTEKVELPGHEIQTDGVGTKVRIYMGAFNGLYEKYRANKSPAGKTALLETSKKLFYRMLLDLYAMNVDDFRHGDVALAVSDILDIDHITLTGEDAEQGEIFCTAFAHAIGQVIEKTGIALVAGETAILGDPDKLTATRNNLGSVIDGLINLQVYMGKIGEIVGQVPAEVARLIESTQVLILRATGAKTVQAEIDRSVDLNVGGSTVGYRNGTKLAPLEAGHIVIALFEQRTEKGIISPRANGISAIRATMKKFLGENWPLKTLKDYFDAMAKEGIPIEDVTRTRLTGMGLNTLLWDIATGETTVFNPLVGGTLLGGVENEPMFDISGQIHVTGNPIGKWSDILGESGFGIDIDYSRTEVVIPQIIEMCMIAEQQDFGSGMEKWNMGIPYALVCTPGHAKALMEEMRERLYPCEQVGTLTKTSGEPMINITYPDGARYSKAVS